jgi:hypothetical protein
MKPATPIRFPSFQVKTKLRHAIFFSTKKESLSANALADVSEWSDNDAGWQDVYCVELIKMTTEDDGYLIDAEQLDTTPYYYN